MSEFPHSPEFAVYGDDKTRAARYNYPEGGRIMDTIKTGAFIAELRHQRGLTQQQLGELVGATNKTVSRWETGVYFQKGD